MKVLLVDDGPAGRDVYRYLLELAGHDVVAAASAGAAAAAIDRQQFDLALIDVDLGRSDGFTVLAHLKSLQPGARAVMVSALDSPDRTARARAGGADRLMVKPVAWNEIQRLLNEIERPTTGREAGANTPNEEAL